MVRDVRDREVLKRSVRYIVDELEPIGLVWYGSTKFGVTDYPLEMGVPIYHFPGKGRGKLSHYDAANLFGCHKMAVRPSRRMFLIEGIETRKAVGMDYQTTLHEALKRKLLEIEGPLEFGNGESRTRKLYYLKRLEDNLAVPMSGKVRSMYEGGSGSELDWKMCSIRSSSAMTFNLLGNGPVKVVSGRHAGTYELAYEYQLPTLRNNPHPANLDAYLQGESEDVYCEMKMFEWLATPHHVLRPDYLETTHYLVPCEDAECFIALFRKLASVGVVGKGR